MESPWGSFLLQRCAIVVLLFRSPRSFFIMGSQEHTLPSGAGGYLEHALNFCLAATQTGTHQATIIDLPCSRSVCAGGWFLIELRPREARPENSSIYICLYYVMDEEEEELSGSSLGSHDIHC